VAHLRCGALTAKPIVLAGEHVVMAGTPQQGAANVLASADTDREPQGDNDELVKNRVYGTSVLLPERKT
jgi:hypothetical protein